MFKNLFDKSGGRAGPTIEALRLDSMGWTERERSDTRIVWMRPDLPQLLVVEFFDVVPNLPSPMADKDALMHGYALSAANGGGALVDFSVVEAAGFPAIYFVAKLPREGAQGIHVMGSITIPFQNCSFVVRVEMPEGEPAGMREAVILDEMLKDGHVQVDSSGQMRGWIVDRELMPNTLRANRADDPTFDQFFLMHPLTQVRAALNHVLSSLAFDPQAVDKLQTFG